MKQIYLRKEYSEQEWAQLPTNRHTKFLFADGYGLIAQSNYIKELEKIIKWLHLKKAVIVLNDKQKTNILY